MPRYTVAITEIVEYLVPVEAADEAGAKEAANEIFVQSEDIGEFFVAVRARGIYGVNTVAESEVRCPDCGADVPGIFEHVDGCPDFGPVEGARAGVIEALGGMNATPLLTECPPCELVAHWIGRSVRMLCQCKGDDHMGAERTTEPGAIGTIERIEILPAPQGLAYTIHIPVGDGRGIVNVFDQTDGERSTLFTII
jgi:hypothetical protein